jgi:hypothetical protein
MVSCYLTLSARASNNYKRCRHHWVHRTSTRQLVHCVSLYTHKWCAHSFEQARGGSGAWYAMELTELLPHVARGLDIDWDEATRYAGLANAE